MGTRQRAAGLRLRRQTSECALSEPAWMNSNRVAARLLNVGGDMKAERTGGFTTYRLAHGVDDRIGARRVPPKKTAGRSSSERGQTCPTRCVANPADCGTKQRRRAESEVEQRACLLD